MQILGLYEIIISNIVATNYDGCTFVLEKIYNKNYEKSFLTSFVKSKRIHLDIILLLHVTHFGVKLYLAKRIISRIPFLRKNLEKKDWLFSTFRQIVVKLTISVAITN